MQRRCNDQLCQNRMINEGEEVRCSKCDKIFHKQCFDNHNKEKHSGKAYIASVPKI
jgi:hypothetical protein